MFKKAFIGCDHTGESLKTAIKNFFTQNKIDFDEVLMQDDYTDVASEISKKVALNQGSLGVIICGSGVGVSIVANRFKSVRASLCHSTQISELSRKHNDANIVCLGARILPIETQLEIVKTFINTSFEGGRHEIRIKKIDL
jgi:ribose 5-phosphate isomerase B